MARLRWITAFLAMLVGTGLVWSQAAAPAPPKPDDPTGRIITVSEAGKLPQQCKVLKWWTQPDGHRAMQVEALDTRETMTITEVGQPQIGDLSSSGGRLRSVSSRIFHWGRNKVPPPGAPRPPAMVCTCSECQCVPTPEGPLTPKAVNTPAIGGGKTEPPLLKFTPGTGIATTPLPVVPQQTKPTPAWGLTPGTGVATTPLPVVPQQTKPTPTWGQTPRTGVATTLPSVVPEQSKPTSPWGLMPGTGVATTLPPVVPEQSKPTPIWGRTPGTGVATTLPPVVPEQNKPTPWGQSPRLPSTINGSQPSVTTLPSQESAQGLPQKREGWSVPSGTPLPVIVEGSKFPSQLPKVVEPGKLPERREPSADQTAKQPEVRQPKVVVIEPAKQALPSQPTVIEPAKQPNQRVAVLTDPDKLPFPPLPGGDQSLKAPDPKPLPPIEPAKPGNWRESWGESVKETPFPVKKGEGNTSTSPTVTAPAKPAPATAPNPIANIDRKPPSVLKTDRPQVNTMLPDPLLTPDPILRRPTPGNSTGAMNDANKPSVQGLPPTPATAPVVPPAPVPRVNAGLPPLTQGLPPAPTPAPVVPPAPVPRVNAGLPPLTQGLPPAPTPAPVVPPAPVPRVNAGLLPLTQPGSQPATGTGPAKNADLPHANTMLPDPLLTPDPILRRPTPSSFTVAMNDVTKPSVQGSPPAPTPFVPPAPVPGVNGGLPPLTQPGSQPATGTGPAKNPAPPAAPLPALSGGTPSAVPASPGPGSVSPIAPGKGEQVPLGAQSVLASGNVQYIPVPVVTIPPPRRMSPAPMPQIPQPPQAPHPTGPGIAAPEDTSGKAWVNAFTPSEEIPPPPASPMGRANANAFGGMYGPPSAPGMLPPGMPSPPVSGPFGPSASMYPPMGGPGYPPMGGPAFPRMPPVNPYGPVVQMAMVPPMGGRPAPGAGLVPAGYLPGAGQPMQNGVNPPQLLAMLHDSLFPSQREFAAEKLTALDWRTNEAVVRALVQTAREDPAATVRAACVHALVKMKVDTVPVVTALQALKADTDVRVRDEAEQGLAILAPNLTLPTSPATIPVGGTSPAPATMPVPVPGPSSVPTPTPSAKPSLSPPPGSQG